MPIRTYNGALASIVAIMLFFTIIILTVVLVKTDRVYEENEDLKQDIQYQTKDLQNCLRHVFYGTTSDCDCVVYVPPHADNEDMEGVKFDFGVCEKGSTRGFCKLNMGDFCYDFNE